MPSPAPTLPPYEPTGDVVADKATWRALVRAARRELVGRWDEGERARLAARLGTEALAFVRRQVGAPAHGDLVGTTVTCYEPMRTEPPVDGISAALTAAGVRVLVPITLEKPRLDWADLADPERTPLGPDALADVAVAFVPALAVSTDGVRLGQGGGYYDTTLPLLRELTRGAAPVVVCLHDHEVVPALPADEHDAVMDAVLRPDTGVLPLPRS